MKPIPRIISVDMLIKNQKKTEIVCGFYGYSHPKCKRSMKRDDLLYLEFLKQFKIDEEEISKPTNNE